MTRKRIDEMGKQYGSWTIVDIHEYRYDTTNGHTGGWFQWVAECACGYRTEVQIGILRSGKSKGCRLCSMDRSRKRLAEMREAKFQALAKHAP